ncbi:MAG TPA: hypothetical protein VKP65_00200 [Rhodothermales bacterium]|nr:hypothetical protein [Rhodothermales bacterium]
MLYRSGTSLLLVLFATLTLACSGSQPLSGDWDFLGSRKVNHAVDRDEIAVTVRDGTFKSIKLRVRDRQVTVRDVKVHYANGDVQDIKLRSKIPAGGETRVIDLNGNNRVIRKVVFWYNTSRVRGKRATVQLFGKH